MCRQAMNAGLYLDLQTKEKEKSTLSFACRIHSIFVIKSRNLNVTDASTWPNFKYPPGTKPLSRQRLRRFWNWSITLSHIPLYRHFHSWLGHLLSQWALQSSPSFSGDLRERKFRFVLCLENKGEVQVSFRLIRRFLNFWRFHWGGPGDSWWIVKKSMT